MRPRTLAFAAAAVVLAAFVVDPLIGLVREAFEGDGFARFAELLGRRTHRAALAESLFLSAASVLAAAAVGLPLAFLTRGLGAFGATLRGVAFAPLLLTPVLGVLGFYFLLGRGGVASKLVPGYEGEFRGFGAVLTVHAFTLFPFFFAFASAALERFDRGLVEAARSLGASPSRAFVTVVLPALAPGMIGAAALTFMSSMGSFTAPYVFGGETRVLTTAVVVARQDSPADAAALSLVLLVASLASLLPLALLKGRDLRAKSGSSREPQLDSGALLRRAVSAAAIASAVAAPLLVVLLVSFKRAGRIGGEGLLADLTLAHYADAFAGLTGRVGYGPDAELLAALGRSLLYSAIATALGTAFVLVLSLASRGAGRFARAAVLGAAMLPFAIPGTALALALLATFVDRGPFGLGGGWVGTASLLVAAYAIRNLPLHLRATEAALAQIPSGVEEASRTLGRGSLATVFRIVLPLLLPGVTAGALLAFVSGAGEFVASVLLATVFTKPASVAVYEAFGGADFGGAAAAGVLLAVATALGAGLLKGAAVMAERGAARPL